jgi:hypothetical protein
MKPNTGRVLGVLALEGGSVLLVLIIAWVGGLSTANRNRADIPGRLTYNGKPVSRSMVALVPSGQSEPVLAALCPVLPDGTFTLPAGRDDAPLNPGRYYVFIGLEEYHLAWYKYRRTEALGAKAAEPVPLGIPAFLGPKRIPTRFMNPNTSGLWVTIRPESRRILSYDIALRD